MVAALTTATVTFVTLATVMLTDVMVGTLAATDATVMLTDATFTDAAVTLTTATFVAAAATPATFTDSVVTLTAILGGDSLDRILLSLPLVALLRLAAGLLGNPILGERDIGQNTLRSNHQKPCSSHVHQV